MLWLELDANDFHIFQLIVTFGMSATLLIVIVCLSGTGLPNILECPLNEFDIFVCWHEICLQSAKLLIASVVKATEVYCVVRQRDWCQNTDTYDAQQ